MADNIGVTQGSGTNVATDEVAGVHYQRVKQCFGVDGSATDVSPSNPLPTDPTISINLAEKGVLVEETSVDILAANNTRKYFFIQNQGPNVAYIAQDGSAAEANSTCEVFPVWGVMEIKGALSRKKITGICKSGESANLHVKEG